MGERPQEEEDEIVHKRTCSTQRGQSTKPETLQTSRGNRGTLTSRGNATVMQSHWHQTSYTDIRGRVKRPFRCAPVRTGQSPWLNCEGKHHETGRITPVTLSELRIQDFRQPLLCEKGCWHFHPRAETHHEQGVIEQRKPAILLSQRSRDHSKSPRAYQFLPLGTCHIHAKPGASPTRLRSHVQQEGGLLQSSRT